MLVDAQWPPPEPENDGPSFRVPRFAWPLLMVLCLVVADFMPPLVGYALLIFSLYCAVESFALLLPNGDGLRKHQQ
jgi:hypothetical protein